MSNQKAPIKILPTRQPSQVSRSLSVTSNKNQASGLRRFSTASAARPNTSSHPQVGFVDDTIQRGVHKLGELPRYLKQSRRPSTVGSSRQSECKETHRKPNREHKVAQASQVRRDNTVILRTEGVGDTLETVIQELEQRIRRQQTRNQEQGAEIEIKTFVIKQREEEIIQLKKQLAKSEIALEERQDQIFELSEKAEDVNWLRDCLQHAKKTRRSSEEQMNKLQREIALLKKQTSQRNEDISKANIALEAHSAEFEEGKQLFHAKWKDAIGSLRANFAKITSSEDEDD